MRISKEKAAANRGQVLASASELFRARGFDGVAVGDIMKAAGFTHGGFYNHFESKEALAAEALAAAFDQMAGQRARSRDLKEMLTLYLSAAARRAPAKSCPAAALANDASRQPAQVRKAFAEGVEQMIASVAGQLPARHRSGLSQRGRAVAIVARMVGALALARAVPDSSPLASELLDASLRTMLRDLD